MNRALSILAFGLVAATGSVSPAQEEAPEPPPVPVLPPLAAVVSLAPVAPVAPTAPLTARVAPAGVPEVLRISTAAAPDMAALRVAVAALSAEELARVTVALSGNSAALRAFVAALEPGQVATATLAVSGDPDALRVWLASLPAEKLAIARASLFAADIAGWQAAAEWLAEPGVERLAPSGARLPALPWGGGNWLDTARTRLRQRIQREGYSPAALAEAQALMRRAMDTIIENQSSQPPKPPHP